MAGLCAPLSTLRQYPRGYLRMTRGRCGSLLLHRDGLAPSTPCRSPGALRSTLINGHSQSPSTCLKGANNGSARLIRSPRRPAQNATSGAVVCSLRAAVSRWHEIARCTRERKQLAEKRRRWVFSTAPVGARSIGCFGRSHTRMPDLTANTLLRFSLLALSPICIRPVCRPAYTTQSNTYHSGSGYIAHRARPTCIRLLRHPCLCNMIWISCRDDHQDGCPVAEDCREISDRSPVRHSYVHEQKPKAKVANKTASQT